MATLIIAVICSSSQVLRCGCLLHKIYVTSVLMISSSIQADTIYALELKYRCKISIICTAYPAQTDELIQ